MNQIEIRQEIMNDKERFLAKCNEQEKPIFKAILDKKEQELLQSKKTAKTIAETTREVMEQPFVKFDDDSSLTIQDMLVASATRNMLSNPKMSFREINDVQKVISNDVDTNKNGCTIIINTNGQDLGD